MPRMRLKGGRKQEINPRDGNSHSSCLRKKRMLKKWILLPMKKPKIHKKTYKRGVLIMKFQELQDTHRGRR